MFGVKKPGPPKAEEKKEEEVAESEE